MDIPPPPLSSQVPSPAAGTTPPVAVPQPSPTPPPPPPPQPQTSPLSQPASPSGPSSAPVPASKKGFPIKMIIGVLALILVIAGLIYGAVSLKKRSEAITLNYWGLWEPESTMASVISEYESSHPGVKVVYRQENILEYRERLQNAISRGEGPDIFRIHSSWVPMFRSELSPMPETVYTQEEFASTFYPAAKDSLLTSSGYLAMPLAYDGLAMYTNDSLMEESGQAIPRSWDEVRNAALAMTKCDTPDGVCRAESKLLVSGAALGTADNVDHWEDIISVIMLQNNVNLLTPNLPNSKPANDAFEYYSNFTRAYNIWNSTLPSSTSRFIEGKVGIYFAPSWRVFEIKEANPNLRFSLHQLPQLPLDPERNEQPITWGTFWVEGVNRRSENSAAAWEFLKFLSSKDIQPKLHDAQKTETQRAFGEIYSRRDLADLASGNVYMSPILKDAPYSKGWFIASATFDGQTGVNTKLRESFAKVINGQADVNTLASEIAATLLQYGIQAAP